MTLDPDVNDRALVSSGCKGHGTSFSMPSIMGRKFVFKTIQYVAVTHCKQILVSLKQMQANIVSFAFLAPDMTSFSQQTIAIAPIEYATKNQQKRYDDNNNINEPINIKSIPSNHGNIISSLHYTNEVFHFRHLCRKLLQT
jgi:hypothetical protein